MTPLRQLAEAIASDACHKDPRRCKLRNLKLLYLGCNVDEIEKDMSDVGEQSIGIHLNEHLRCGE